jgi:hypothetical protein
MEEIPGNLTANMLIAGDPTTGQRVGPATAMSRLDEWWPAAAVLLTGYALVLAVARASLTTLTTRRGCPAPWTWSPGRRPEA